MRLFKAASFAMVLLQAIERSSAVRSGDGGAQWCGWSHGDPQGLVCIFVVLGVVRVIVPWQVGFRSLRVCACVACNLFFDLI